MSATVTVQRQKLEWYIKLLQDLQKLIVKREKADLEVKHAIGKRILEEKSKITESITGFLEKLANDLDYSLREIWYCVKFAETYPTMDDLIKDYAKSKGVSVDSVSLDDLPTWRDLRNFILSKGFEAISKEGKGEKLPEEPKLCKLEKILSDFLIALSPKKAETLDCNECDLREKCDKVKPKILQLGEQLVGD